MRGLDPNDDRRLTCGHETKTVMDVGEMLWIFVAHGLSDLQQLVKRHFIIMAVFDSCDFPVIFEVPDHTMKAQISPVNARQGERPFNSVNGFLRNRTSEMSACHEESVFDDMK